MGSTTRRWLGSWRLKVLFVLGSFAAAALVAVGVVSGADQPSISSDRTDYAPGDAVELSGTGWLAGEPVLVLVDDDQSDLWSHEAVLTALADGTVSDSFDLPDVAGEFSVTATAPSGTASATFTVTAPAPPPPTGTPTLDTDEEEYEPGATVTLNGTDWQAGDTVHVTVDDDADDAWDHTADVTVAADGTLTDSFDLPDDLAAGFTATATDPSDRSATATFETVSAPTGTPTLDSDEEAYAPGDTVTLSGSDWRAGDTVHVAVDDDQSDAWEHSADVTVAADGTLTDTFELPDGLAAEFTATATDPADRSATATFSAGFGTATEPYLVRFASGTSTETQAQILAAAGAVDESYIAPLRIHGVLLPGGDDLQTSLDKLRSYPSVTRVEPDRTREAGGTPNDSSYGDQWSLGKIGWENVFGNVSPSGSARVAILDTGIDGSHPDLDGNVVAGTSILDGSDGLDDPNGHGTAMAGIIAAETDNGAGIAGVGYAGVQVMPVTVLDSDGTGQDSDIIEGVVYAADNGADVILMAFSNPGYSEMLQAAIDYAWEEGVVLVAATGNDGSSNVTFPAGDRGVIGVSNTDENDALNGSSNYGQAVFLGAPGTGIPTTDAGGGTTSITGTSAAAAHVAGAAALVKAASGASNGVIVSRLAKNAEAAGSQAQTGNGRLNLDRAVNDSSTDSIQPSGAAPIGGGGPFVGPYVAAANNDAHVTPGWAPTNTVTTFNSLYRKTTGGTVQHVRITLPVGYTNISVPATAFSSGTWSAPTINQVTRTIDVELTAGTGLATNNVDWARIDVTATTPLANQSGNAAEWLMQTFTNTLGTVGEQNDNPPVLIGVITNPSATITFLDGSLNPITNPVLQNGVAATVRVRITQSGSGIKYTDVSVPTCFSSPTGVTISNPGGNPYNTPIVTDGFIRMGGGDIATNGTLTVTFTTTPNCTSGTYFVASDPSTNATNPPSGTNQSVSTTGGSLTVAAGLAGLSITKTDSPDPVTTNGTLTYTINVTNAGPDDASAVKVVDTLPAGVTFVSATGTNWTCNNVSGTVTCNRTGGNLAPGPAPTITIVVTAPGTAGTITNTATVSSPNDDTPGNNTATATTTVQNQGKIELQKDFVGGTDNVTLRIGTTQDGTQTASQALTADGTTGEKTVVAGTYFVSEALTNASNFDVLLACYNDTNDNDLVDGNDTSHTVNTSTGAVVVGSNEDVLCTFTNQRKPEVKLVKVLNPTDDPGRFDLRINTTNFDNSGAGYGHNGTTGFQKVAVGTVNVSESGHGSTALADYDSKVACDSGKLGNDPATSHSFSVAYGDQVTCTFTNTRKATLSGVKFEDQNADGTDAPNPADPGLSGWTIKAFEDSNNDGDLDSGEPLRDSDVTVAGGAYELTLSAGKRYVICEQTSDHPGYFQSAPPLNSVCAGGGSTLGARGHATAVLTAGQVVTGLDFGNFRQGTVSGLKFEDENRDGNNAADPADPGLSGWQIRAFEDGGDGILSPTEAAATPADTEVTNASGMYTLTLDPGAYVVCETLMVNWIQRVPAGNTRCDNVSGAGNAGYTVTVTSGSSEGAKDFGNVRFSSTSLMTNSAFQLVDDLAPWTITDFEILLNGQNTIVATNPGQFYYHQRGTNTSGSTGSMQFTIKWPCQFTTQTAGGQPIHAYVQLPSDPPNTWRDWLSQSSNVTWNNPSCPTAGTGTITVNNVPDNAKVWVNVHLDYKLKGTTAPSSNFGNPPITYGPFESTIVIADVGSSYSSTTLLGRGKKVTVVYGRATDQAGTAMPGVWIRVMQGANWAIARTDGDGNYLFYDGQNCAIADGLQSCSGSAWTFANGNNQATKLDILGDAAAAAGSPTYPGGKASASVRNGNQTLMSFTSTPPGYTFGVTKGSANNRDWRFGS